MEGVVHGSRSSLPSRPGRDGRRETTGAQRNAANLAKTFQELDAARPNTVRRVPSEATVAGWIADAKTMEKTVTHLALGRARLADSGGWVERHFRDFCQIVNE